ncbi:purpurin-like [Saccostrea echinata]|uniref:purpurin-like n=1 Tax=Saccostrea echinata TaxID=191078 RepID=UPI002A838031|nr:purpurin-like [Saccostrea echinata]
MGGYIRKWTFVFCIFSYGAYSTFGINCDVSNFAVQSNFDPSKYVGVWYEIKWFSKTPLPKNKEWQDVTHTYSIVKGNNISVVTTYRDPQRLGTCSTFQSTLIPTGRPGKLLFDEQKTDEIVNYWVMNTDYVNYALIYGFKDENTNGTAKAAKSWVWSRKPTLAKSFLQNINTQLQNLCLNETMGHITVQNKVCSWSWGLDEIAIQEDIQIARHGGSCKLIGMTDLGVEEKFIDAYDWDKKHGLSIHQKFTSQHLRPNQADKMRNHLAEDIIENIFSQQRGLHHGAGSCRTFAEGGGEGSNTWGASTCHKEEVKGATEKDSSSQKTV